MNIFSTLIEKSWTNKKIISSIDTLFFLHRNSLNKWKLLDSFLNNPFFEFEEIMERFYVIQKTHHILIRFRQRCMFHRPQKFVNECDLHMNPFLPQQKGVMMVVQNKQKYQFRLSEVISIVRHALEQKHEPLPCKNPYNNMYFSKTTLYNLYFQIRLSTTMVMPENIQRFFLCHFDLGVFYQLYFVSIKQQYVQQMHQGMTHEQLVLDIITMIDYYNKYYSFYEIQTLKIKINNEFPFDKLIDIFLPYVHLYHGFLYSQNIDQANDFHTRFIRKMNRFVRFNPQFGRKKIHISLANKNEKMSKKVSFDMRHVPFEKIENILFFFQSHTHLNSNELQPDESIPFVENWRKIYDLLKIQPLFSEEEEEEEEEYYGEEGEGEEGEEEEEEQKEIESVS